MLHGPDRGLEQRLHPCGIAVALILEVLNLGEALGQAIARIRCRVQMKERVDLTLNTPNIVRKTFGLFRELPEERHILGNAPRHGDLIQGGQLQNLIGFNEDRLNRGNDVLG
jgi:hypothetical protein